MLTFALFEALYVKFQATFGRIQVVPSAIPEGMYLTMYAYKTVHQNVYFSLWTLRKRLLERQRPRTDLHIRLLGSG